MELINIHEEIKNKLKNYLTFEAVNDNFGILTLPVFLACGKQLMIFISEEQNYYELATNTFQQIDIDFGILDYAKKTIKRKTFSEIKEIYLKNINTDTMQFEYKIEKEINTSDLSIEILKYAENIKNFYNFLHNHLTHNQKSNDKTQTFENVVQQVIFNLTKNEDKNIWLLRNQSNLSRDSYYTDKKNNIITPIKNSSDFMSAYLDIKNKLSKENKIATLLFLIKKKEINSDVLESYRKDFEENYKINMDYIPINKNDKPDELEKNFYKILEKTS